MRINLGTYKNRGVAFDCENALNKHLLILGKSGGGKTVEAQKIMTEIVKEGGTVMALDLHQTLASSQIFWKYKPDFELYTQEVDVYQNGIQCNLLEQITFEDGVQEQLIDTVAAITNVFSRILNLKCNQQAVLREAINHVCDKNTFEQNGFQAVGEELCEMNTKMSQALYEKLYQLFAHNVFRPGNRFLENGKINIIRLGRFALGVQEMIADVLLSYIWRLAMTGKFSQSGLFIFVDECQNLASGKNSLLAQILSEGRKFNVNLILATQIIPQDSTSVIQHYLTQCGMILYFQPDARHLSVIARMIDPVSAGEWMPVLRTLKRGEFVASGALTVDGGVIDKPLKVTAFEKNC